MGSRGWVWSASAGPAPPLLLLAPLPRPGLSLLLLLRSPRPPLPSRPVRPAGGEGRAPPPARRRWSSSRWLPATRAGAAPCGGRAFAASRPPLRAAPGWVVGGGGSVAVVWGWGGGVLGAGAPWAPVGRVCASGAPCAETHPTPPASGCRFEVCWPAWGTPFPMSGSGTVPCLAATLKKVVRLLAVDHSARASMKNAASCEN